MLTVFNRKELIVTIDLRRQGEVRSILAQNQIEYHVKTTSLLGSNGLGGHRGHSGSLGIRVENAYEYQIYVHKKDYDRAARLIAGKE